MDDYRYCEVYQDKLNRIKLITAGPPPRYTKQDIRKLRVCYSHVKQRCTNPKCKAYPTIGGRGIRFKLGTFKEFLYHCQYVLRVYPQDKELFWINPAKDYTLDNITFVKSRRKRKHRALDSKYPIAISDMR